MFEEKDAHAKKLPDSPMFELSVLDSVTLSRKLTFDDSPTKDQRR